MTQSLPALLPDLSNHLPLYSPRHHLPPVLRPLLPILRCLLRTLPHPLLKVPALPAPALLFLYGTDSEAPRQASSYHPTSSSAAPLFSAALLLPPH